MTDPRRWMDTRRTGLRARLLRSAAAESAPDGALLRAGKRLGVSASLLAAGATSMAQAAAAPALSAGSHATVAATVGSATIVATVAKAVGVGFGIGSLMVGAAQLTTTYTHELLQNPARSTLGPAASPEMSGNAGVGLHQDSPHDAAVHAEVQSPRQAAELPPAVVHPIVQAERSVMSRSMSPPGHSPTSPHTIGRDASAELHPVNVARFADVPTPVASGTVSSAAVGIAVATAAGTAEEPPSTDMPRSLLAREVRALDAVHEALRAGNAQQALTLLNRNLQLGVFRVLNREASILRVEALGAVGRTTEAALLARQLLSGAVTRTQQKALERWTETVKP